MSVTEAAGAAPARYDRYDPWARLYNRTMGPAYGAAQLGWLERVLLPHLPAGAALLDLCCGTGQLIPPLLARGYRVTGLDGSADMLACARENAPGATFVLQDARRLDVEAAFDGIFCTSASLNHIDSLADLAQVFRNVHRALWPGGVFAFDINHPGQLAKWWRGEPVEGEIGADAAWYLTPRYDAVTARGGFTVTAYAPPPTPASGLAATLRRALYRQLARPRFVGLRLRVLGAFARLEPGWTSTEIDFPVTGHALDDVRSALEASGFDPVTLCSIDGDAPPDDDRSAHFVCTRPGGDA